MPDRASAILDALDEGVVVVDASATVSMTNSRFCELVGLPRDIVVGSSPPFPWWPDDEARAEREARLRRELHAGGDVAHHQVVFRRADGVLVLAEGRLRRIDESDEFVLSYREVTDEALRDQRMARLVETTNDALVRVALDGSILFVSEGAAAFAGVPAEEVVGSSMVRFLHPDDLPLVGRAFERALAGNTSTEEYRFVSATGETYWLEGTSAPIIGLDGSVVEVQVISRDITDRVLTDKMNTAVLGVIAAEAHGGDRLAVERAIAERAREITAATTVQVLRMGPDGPEVSVIAPDGAPLQADAVLARRAMQSAEPIRDTAPGGAPAMAVGLPVTRGAAGAIVVRGAVAPRSASLLGELARRVGIALDASEAQERLRMLAQTDPLTGLMNRRAFTTATEQAIVLARDGAPVALALIDLDGLKAINDRGGHAAGDRALVHIGHCVRDASRGGDAIGRLGGDEFAWIIHPADLDAAHAAAERLRQAIGSAEGDGVEGVSASIGVTVVRPDDDADSIMRRADALLYAAKAAGRDRTEAAA